ncbi:MAG: hypothetical protein J6Y20_01155 [Lachnospiraceae bacterium]|nr:hypothetical protein [Lachnospiraceae bacterium]
MKNVKNDLTGRRFGRLSVIGVDDRGTRKTYFWCECDCGTVKSIRGDGLLSGRIVSCGCKKREQDRINLEANHKHKMSHTRPYEIWQGIKGRCYNKNDARYSRYGGRGITVCEEWRKDFSAFYEWALANGYRDDLTIDRIDNNKGYSPDNCRWADQETQSRNRASNVKIRIGNATRTLVEWCEIFDLNYKTVYARYRRNGFIGINELFNG